MAKSRSAAWSAIACAIGLLVFVWSVWPREAWILDDAVIYSAYARSAAEGHGLRFGVGPAVEGFSSPLWMLLLVVLEKVGLHGLVGAKALGALLGAATVLVVARMPVAPRARAVHLFVVLTIALQPAIAWWSVSGLDAPLAVFLLALAATRLVRGDVQGAVAAGALAGVARPEGPLFVLAIVAALVAARAHRRVVAGAACALIALWIAWACARAWMYGAPLPASASKIGQLALAVPPPPWMHEVWKDGLLYAMRTMPGESALAAIAIAALVATRRRLPRRARAVWAAAIVVGVGLIALLVAARGDWMPQARLTLPAMPIGLVAVVALARAARPNVRRVLYAGAALACALTVTRQIYEHRDDPGPFPPGLPVPLPAGADLNRRPFLDATQGDGGENYCATYLIRYTEPGDRVLHLDVGQSGYFADDVEILDQFALVSRDESLLVRGKISDDDYRARFARRLPSVAFLLVDRKDARPVMRVARAVEDILARDYERVALGGWWGGFDLEIKVRRDALGRKADRARWERWARHARGLRFDPPEWLFRQ